MKILTVNTPSEEKSHDLHHAISPTVSSMQDEFHNSVHLAAASLSPEDLDEIEIFSEYLNNLVINVTADPNAANSVDVLKELEILREHLSMMQKSFPDVANDPNFQLARIAVNKPSGFTLIELIVVIGIISGLFLLLLPAAQTAREASRRVVCKNNFRSVATAVLAYETDNGVYPGNLFVDCKIPGNQGVSTNAVATPTTQILPYLDPVLANKMPTYGLGHCSTNVPPNQQLSYDLLRTQIYAFLCPSQPRESIFVPGGVYIKPINTTMFSANVNDPNAAFVNYAHHPLTDIPDGSSSTVLASEMRAGEASNEIIRSVSPSGNNEWPHTGRGYWLYEHFLHPLTSQGQFTLTPNKTSIHTIQSTVSLNTGHANIGRWYKPEMAPSSMHFGGVNAAFADGSVRFVMNSINQDVFRAIISPRGAEVVSSDQY